MKAGYQAITNYYGPLISEQKSVQHKQNTGKKINPTYEHYFSRNKRHHQ